MNDTVAILGNASRTRDFCPFDDEHVDIWAISFHAMHARRFDAVFEVHPEILTGAAWETQTEYRAWLRSNADIPVYMTEPSNDIPASRRYPRGEIEERFACRLWRGEHEVRSFYGGSTSYAIPLAMFLGYRRIELYGIELRALEYLEERDTFFFWLGKASALGMDIVTHEDSRLFQDVLYGRKK